MKVLVISDGHDRKSALKAALEQGKKEGCEAIIFCGDSSSPESCQLLIDDGRPLYAVLGNIENNPEEMIQQVRKATHVYFDSYVLTATCQNRVIGITHYPTMAESLAKEGKYDAIFHGHTHQPRIDYRGRILIGNPGEISGHITGKRTIGIYDPQTNSFQVLPLIFKE